MVGKDVPGKENNMAGGQRLEDWNTFQELQITEHNWYKQVKQEGAVKKVLGNGGAGQRAVAGRIVVLTTLRWNLGQSVVALRDLR